MSQKVGSEQASSELNVNTMFGLERISGVAASGAGIIIFVALVAGFVALVVLGARKVRSRSKHRMNEPDQSLLISLSDNSALAQELDRAAALIGRLRGYGITHLGAMLESRQGAIPNDEAIPLIVGFGMLRWGLELLSSIEVQLRDGWTGPAKVTIRSLFECMLAAKYVLEDPDQRARRARAYLYCESSKTRAFLLSRLPGTEAGKRMTALAERDRFGSALLASLPEEKVREHFAAVEKDMASPWMREIAAEADRLATSGRSNPAWFEFFGGPRNLEQLADKTGYPLSYEVLYRQWSQSAHATAIVRSAVQVTNGKIEILKLRNPVELDEVKVSAFTFGSELYKAIAVVLPGDHSAEFAKWYVDQQADFLRRLRIVDSKGESSSSS